MLTLVDTHVRAADETTPLLEVPRLEVAAGERIVVCGPSGAGKSLLLSVLAGRLLDGLTLTGRRDAPGLERVGFVPQRGVEAFHPLIRLGRQLRVVTGADRTRAGDVLARVGLGDPRLRRRRRRPAELSGGQAQRAAIALAVLSGAGLVVADEPTSALDPQTRDDVLSLLTGALASDAAGAPALVVSTHDPEVAAVLGARRLEVLDGRIVADIPAPCAPEAGAPPAVGEGS